MEKKYCSGCQKDKAVDLFTEPYKMCNRCREKSRRKQQVVYHCDVCNCDIKRSHKSKHERTYRHKEQLEKNELRLV